MENQEDIKGNYEQIVFKELPKENRKALHKEFTSETNIDKPIIISAIVIGATIIALALILNFASNLTANNLSFWIIIFPGIFFGVICPVYVEEKFKYWLLEKKNIVWKRKK